MEKLSFLEEGKLISLDPPMQVPIHSHEKLELPDTCVPLFPSSSFPLVPRLQPGDPMDWRLCRLLRDFEAEPQARCVPRLEPGKEKEDEARASKMGVAKLELGNQRL